MRVNITGLNIKHCRFCCIIPALCIRYLQATFDKGALLEIVFTNEKGIHKLNKKFRGIDKSTDILSFIGNDTMYLGSIAMCNKIIAKYNPGKRFETAMHTTLIHGVLHLLGYDHESEEDAAIMEDLEVRIYKYVQEYLCLQ